jgi:DNA-binding MarR family transcriptional regulator
MVVVARPAPPQDASAAHSQGGPKPAPGEDSASALARALITLYAELDDVYNRAARHLKLTPQQAQLLCSCEHRPSSMTDLAALLNCDKTNITGLVDRVAKRDLVMRSADPNDRRVSQVTLTEQGRELVERFQLELQCRLDERLSHWPPARRQQLIDLATAATSDLVTGSAAQ